MKLLFTPDGWTDYQHWHSADPKLLAKVNALIEDARRTPFKGLGKPEPLRGDRSG